MKVVTRFLRRLDHGQITMTLPKGEQLVSVRKRLFFPDSSLLSEFNPRNIKHMPAVKFIERLDS
jgi:hypothetical protein